MVADNQRNLSPMRMDKNRRIDALEGKVDPTLA
jgi:hypothetical protein